MERIQEIQLGILEATEIERRSVAKITSVTAYDSNGVPLEGGINDLRMGSCDKDFNCKTCGNDRVSCPGHFGHISLGTPVYHPFFIKQIYQILQCICLSCYCLLIPNDDYRISRGKSRLKSIYKLCYTKKRCKHGCGAEKVKLKNQKTYIEYSSDRKLLSAEKALKILCCISPEVYKFIGFDLNFAKPESMILKNLAVLPPIDRPYIKREGMQSEDDLTHQYVQILRVSNKVVELIHRNVPYHVIEKETSVLQFHANALFSNDSAVQAQCKNRNGKPLKSLSERIKGKEGRIRGNLMGKRVNFSARSTITPDPCLKLSQVGIPLSIAKHLTVTEDVTRYNFHKIKQLVKNGPFKYPGARFIYTKKGHYYNLELKHITEIEEGYKVDRHLMDGDFVLLNRQPSLHKMSMMGHSVKVLPYSTLRLNLSTTSPYNADFDGDEMNIHVPQSYESIAELTELMHVHTQIISPQNNRPCMSLVQDSLLGLYLFTHPGVFLTAPSVMQLMMWTEDKILPPPAITHPQLLWTGKQVISSLLPSINLHLPSLEIRNGNIIKGTIDKSKVNAIVNAMFRDFGPERTAKFLNECQYVVNKWLMGRGFSVGISDLMLDSTTKDNIARKLEEAEEKVDSVTQRAYAGDLSCQPGRSIAEHFEFEVNSILNNTRDCVAKHVLENTHSRNSFKLMARAGSKGSDINICQIMGCVGQQNIEGKRVSSIRNNRTLPSFKKYDLSSDSKGFVSHSYIEGLKPQEFFFHAMGGREGLIDTAIKTSEIGYLQRRLVKSLESVTVAHDYSVRTLDGNIVQFLYGEDGMKAEAIEIQSVAFNKDLQDEYVFQDFCLYKDCIEEEVLSQLEADPSIYEILEEEFEEILKAVSVIKQFFPDDSRILPLNVERAIQNINTHRRKSNINPKYAVYKLNELIDSISRHFRSFQEEDPTFLFKSHLRTILSAKQVIVKHKLSTDELDCLLKLLEESFSRCLAIPGEMVGAIASQSLSEPATQMTLNTFHFAGVSSKNVTLGIPRLIELINAVKSIKSPRMLLYPFPDSDINLLTKQIEYTTLKDLTSEIAIYYDPDPKETVVTEDSELVSEYEKTDSEPGAWVIRLVFDKKSIMEKDVKMDEIYNKIASVHEFDCVYSDDNDEKLVFRIRDKYEVLSKLEPTLMGNLHIKGISGVSAIGYRKKDDKWIIETEGSNLEAIFGLEGIEHLRTISSDIHEVARTLGIEAARTLLIKEIRKVLDLYGIYVNYRHICLICDFMTKDGILNSITRHGVANSIESPLQRASFELPVRVISEAAALAEIDRLSGITENVMMGQFAPIGTGSFDILLDLLKLSKMKTRGPQ